MGLGDYSILGCFGYKFQTVCIYSYATEQNWRIAVPSVRIWVSLISGEFCLFQTVSISLILREPSEIEFGTILLVAWLT